MFPIQDTARARSFPLVNWLIILANVAVFIWVELPLGPGQLDALVVQYGVVPRQLLAGRPGEWITLFTSMFLHGGWLHLLSNMWALFIFGDNVEDRMGSGRYLTFYVLSGVAAALTQALVGPTSRVPMVGASGAIAAVLAAYLVLFPGAQVTTLVPLFFLPLFIDIPALLYIGFWFITQFFNGVLALDVSAAGGVAYWAHIGGFVGGLILVSFFAQRRVSYRPYSSNYRS